MWKLHNNLIPKSIGICFSKRYTCNSEENCHKEEFAIPTISTEYKRRFISYSGVKIWREITKSIRMKTTLSQFQAHLRTQLLNNALS